MTSSIDQRGLVGTVDGTDHLVGAECTTCGTRTFPAQGACPRCGASTAVVALPTTGTVWSWTVQRIRPKPPYVGPDEFEPYTVGYVDLGGIKVEGRFEGRESWSIGDEVQLVVGPRGSDGQVWRYRFTAVDVTIDGASTDEEIAS